MRSLRIFVNEIELEHVREDLKVRDENNSFSDQLKVSYTTRPVRIVENKAAVEALGELSISSAGKKKYFPCKIVMGAVRYNGVLTQNDKLNGFRKCDLKFGSAINGIMDKKIAAFFPSYNVTGAETFPEYSSESDAPHGAGQDWINEATARRGQTYPQVKWNLPYMRYRDKFGEDLKKEDTHYKYLGGINYYMLGDLVVNRPANLDAIDPTPYNATVIAPQVFVLSPLYYAFNTLGYVLSGNFVNSAFFRRLFFLSENDNMTKVIQKYPGVNIDITTPSWEQLMTRNFLGFQVPTYAKKVVLIAEEGEFKVRYKIRMPYDISQEFMKSEYGIDVLLNGVRIDSATSTSIETMEGEIPVSISEEQAGQEIEIRYHSFSREMPAEYQIEFAEDLPDLEFHDQHPTIDFARYLPDWTVAQLLNNLQKTFNLKIDFDDVAKEVQINFNEDDYLIGGEALPIRKSLEIGEFKNIPTESYLLKYANDEDHTMLISKEPLNINTVKDENTTPLEMPFKYIPHTSTAALSDAVMDKEGVGLMLAAAGSVNTSDNYNGLTLRISGVGGIGDTYWKRWLLFRLNAAGTTLKGPFTQTELYQISQKKKIYVDHQLWMVKAVDYKENSIALFETEIEVESVTF